MFAIKTIFVALLRLMSLPMALLFLVLRLFISLSVMVGLELLVVCRQNFLSSLGRPFGVALFVTIMPSLSFLYLVGLFRGLQLSEQVASRSLLIHAIDVSHLTAIQAQNPFPFLYSQIHHLERLGDGRALNGTRLPVQFQSAFEGEILFETRVSHSLFSQTKLAGLSVFSDRKSYLLLDWDCEGLPLFGHRNFLRGDSGSHFSDVFWL